MSGPTIFIELSDLWIPDYYIYRSLQHARLGRRQENGTVYAALNLKRNLRSMYCTVEANDRHEASRGLFATAELLVNG